MRLTSIEIALKSASMVVTETRIVLLLFMFRKFIVGVNVASFIRH